MPGAFEGDYAEGNGRVARFNSPGNIVVTDDGTLYVADSLNHRIRQVSPGADAAATQVSTLAGSGTQGHEDGAGRNAQFDSPLGLALSGTTLYVADMNNRRIRAVNLASPENTVRTIAGDGRTGNTNGIGTAARFALPKGIAVRGSTLYVASDRLIRKLEYR